MVADPERRQRLGMLASSLAQNIAFQLPEVEEATFVGSRVFALLVGNGIDLLDMQARGVSIDDAVESFLKHYREIARVTIEARLLNEHVPDGAAH